MRTDHGRARSRIITAVVCAALIGSVGFMAPAAYAASDYPSWSDVEQARGDERAKQTEITRITGLIESLESGAAEAADLAAQRGAEYQRAVDTLDVATGKAETLESEAAAAQTEADEAVEQVGRLIGQLSRSAGSDLSMTLFLDGRNADDLLAKLGTASKLTERSDALYAEAAAATNTARSLGAQAEVARDELAQLAEVANDLLVDATEAQAEAEAAVLEQEENEARLTAQLAVLNDSRVSIEQGYALGEQKRKEAEAAAEAAAREAAARKAAAQQAAAQAAASASAAGVGSSGQPAGGGSTASAGWTMPIRSYDSYQAYGNRLHPIAKVWRLHAGADFGARCGTPLYATTAGTVTFAGPSGGYGNLVVIDHGGGITTAYAHMYSSGVLVRAGQRVMVGQQVAAVGNAGLSTGCHLHFELRSNGIATDPMAYLAARGVYR